MAHQGEAKGSWRTLREGVSRAQLVSTQLFCVYARTEEVFELVMKYCHAAKKRAQQLIHGARVSLAFVVN